MVATSWAEGDGDYRGFRAWVVEGKGVDVEGGVRRGVGGVGWWRCVEEMGGKGEGGGKKGAGGWGGWICVGERGCGVTKRKCDFIWNLFEFIFIQIESIN